MNWKGDGWNKKLGSQIIAELKTSLEGLKNRVYT